MNKIFLLTVVCFNTRASEIYHSDMIDSIIATFPKIDSKNCKILCLDTGTTLIEYGDKIYHTGNYRILVTNKNGVNFLVIVDNNAVKLDNIRKWLEQFYKKKIDHSNVHITIPVIYGNARTLLIQPDASTLLLTIKETSEIKILYRYKIIVKAPITKNDEIGYIVYNTSIYKNPIIKQLSAGCNIKTTTWIQCIRDSFYYLLFGSSWFNKK